VGVTHRNPTKEGEATTMTANTVPRANPTPGEVTQAPRAGLRPRSPRRLLAGAVGSTLVVVVLAAGCSSASPRPGGPGQAAAPAWLCRPGQTADPCASGLAATTVTAAGTLSPATWPTSPLAAQFACFYVHPTDSLATAANTGLAPTKLDRYVASEQAAPLSRVCDVWAPAYRSQTWPTVQKFLDGDTAILHPTFTTAYNSILPAWHWFLAHTGGKPIILAGDSQGAAILIHLIAAQLDHQPSILRRLLVAVLVGGNLQVPAGQTAGATFTNVPLCTTPTQAGCAIAFSSYPAQPPPDSQFGRPGRGVSLQSGQTTRAGQQVACVNPAALTGGTGNLDPYLTTVSQIIQYPGDKGRLTQHITTPWVTYPHLYTATCQQGDGASWLQITTHAAVADTRPVVTTATVGTLGGTGPAWGYHSYEYWLTLGNLLRDITAEETAWQSSH
jgi:hypothetical protein